MGVLVSSRTSGMIIKVHVELKTPEKTERRGVREGGNLDLV